MNGFVDQLPLLKKIYQEEISLPRSFEETAACFAQDQGTVVLLSGTDLDCARYHILAVWPWLEITARKETISVNCRGRISRVEQDVFATLQFLLDRFRLEAAEDGLPVQCGLFGYFSYDLKDRIEALPVTCLDTGLPDLYLSAPSAILIRDKQMQKTCLCIPEFRAGEGLDHPAESIASVRNRFFRKMASPPFTGPFSIQGPGFKSSFTKAEYIRAVKRITAYLNAGDIYQANLSQRFEAAFSGDAYALFMDLFQRNPAAFFSFVQAGDHTIVSTSPERFIKQTGREVETRPIKGTIARGTTRGEDLENGNRLVNSEKDDAELTMIVDLMRNDLSRVTRHGSVVVRQHKRLEPYENVYHLVSIVKGELLPGKTSLDFLKAAFPGGSITGCPKIRAMEIIDELEPVKRHVYTGAIGYISFHRTMDLSIAIRTATIYNKTVFFSVGGGIVYDSDPEKEFQETLDKGKTLMESLAGSIPARQEKRDTATAKAWVNGKIIDRDQAVVPATAPGFQYGAGIFETIKVCGRTIYYLEDHVKRMNRAWEAVFDAPAPDISWREVIRLLIRENRFQSRDLAVKLILAKADQTVRKATFLAAFAREYVHRLVPAGKPGLDLVTYPYPRQSPLADYKTMNYLYYERAGRFAGRNKADEALILNPDETVSETHTANIFAVSGKRVIVPESLHVLDGIMLKKVLQLFEDRGYEIRRQPVSAGRIKALPNVILTNSLMGAVKVLSIDGEKIVHDDTVCTGINGQLFPSETDKR